jgi:hypothetical protein
LSDTGTCRGCLHTYFRQRRCTFHTQAEEEEETEEELCREKKRRGSTGSCGASSSKKAKKSLAITDKQDESDGEAEEEPVEEAGFDSTSDSDVAKGRFAITKTTTKKAPTKEATPKTNTTLGEFEQFLAGAMTKACVTMDADELSNVAECLRAERIDSEGARFIQTNWLLSLVNVTIAVSL